MRLHLYKKKSLSLGEKSSLVKKFQGKKMFIQKIIQSIVHKGRQNSLYKPFFEMKVGESKDIVVHYKKGTNINLGYLIYKGFDLVDVKPLSEEEKIITLKRVLLRLREDKHYSLLIKLPRTGKGGKRIYVYKLRTMKPYSEYLQKAIIKINGLNSDGTIRNDFRITRVGRFFRKYWIDELPMLLNFLKGDLKIIGVRPLSDAMLSQYPQDFVPFRNQFKPGLIPPYYIDRPKSFEEIIESEKRYLERYKKAPITTDLIYFVKFLDRIVLKGVRSK